MEKKPVQMLIESVDYWNIKMDCPNLFKAICEEAINLENLETKLDDPLNKFIDEYKPKERMFDIKDMELAFETGRNFQITGENNFVELIKQLKKQ